ncbi:S8 family serine peptidase [Rossellomorea sp. NPDC077527]|uniref:S8 family serine peptidase n=1 Tax=Rossellomorea sp. NPDC077527 TaxID=3364510 RepID=UPI0037C4F281
MNTKKNLLIYALGAGMMLSSVNIPGVNVLAEKPSTIEDALSNLTPQQLENYKQLQSVEKEGLFLSQNVNLDSNDSIKVIVQLDHHPEKVAMLKAKLEGKPLTQKEAKDNVANDQKKLKQDLDRMIKDKSQSGFKIGKTYENAMNGVSLEVPANRVQELLSLDVVRAIWSDVEVQVEPPVTNTTEEQKDEYIVESMPHLKIDQLHSEGFTGKGIKVGVIDTGIDYNHPDLDGVYKGGYDFVDNDNDPMETTYADWQASGNPEVYRGNSYYTEHGTHVSGTIAGQGDNDQSEYSVKGVAPEADLYGYRVLGPYGSGSSENVIAGIDKAVEQGMDVINLSLGATVNDPLYPTSIAINNAVLSGVTAVVSAGNSGSAAFTLGSPGTSALALTVGASDVPIGIPTFNGQYGSNAVHLQLMAKNYSDKISDFEGASYELVNAGLGGNSNYSSIKDKVKGNIALVSRGSYSFVDKIKYAKENGAKAIIIYNNEDGQIPYYLGEGVDNIPTFSLSKEEGENLKNSLEEGKTITFNDLGEMKTEGDRLADFSSRGPSKMNYDIKPEIVAPGVSVLSTVPSYINDKVNGTYDYAYTRLSGTSMASPHVAGIAALLLQSNKSYTPADVKSKLMNTADPLNGDYSVYEVGAGRVDPYEAIHSRVNFQVVDETPTLYNGEEVTIDERTGGMSFGLQYVEGKPLHDQRTIEITNSGDKDKTFQASVEFTSNSMDAAGNKVSLSYADKLTINAGKSKKTKVFLDVPATAEKGYYEGYVKYVNSEDPSEEYQIPFGIRVSEEGIEALEAFNFSTKQNNQFGTLFNFTPGSFVLRSPMEQMSLVLVDPKTNKDLGLIASFNPTGIKEGQRIVFNSIFSGYYYPYTRNKKNPFSVNPTLAPEGHYKLKLVGVNAKGKTFTKETDTFIDNTAPKFSSSLPNGVYEYAPGKETVPVSLKLYDNEIDQMKAAGLDVDQSNNYITYYWASPFPSPVPLITDASGNLNEEILMHPRLDRYPLAFFPYDSVGNLAENGPVLNAFVVEGTPYMTTVSNKSELTAGDEFKLTLTANNVKKFKEGNFTVTYDKNEMEVKDVVLNPEFKSYSESTIEHEIKDKSSYQNNLDIAVSLEEDSTIDVTGDTPVVDIILEAKEASYSKRNQLKLPTLTASYINTDGQETKNIRGYFAGDIPELLRSYSEARGSIIPQGFYGMDGKFDYDKDFSNAPISIIVTDPDGGKHEGTLNKTTFSVSDLPITDKPFNFEVKIPGHFPVNTSVKIYEQRGDRVIGTWREFPIRKQDAGDINQDSVIDIFDAVALKESWGTDKQEADLNFDGVINEEDFELVEYNYLETDPGVDKAPTPKQMYQGQTLESIKKELGIN